MRRIHQPWGEKTHFITVLMCSHGLERTWWEQGQEALSGRMRCTKPPSKLDCVYCILWFWPASGHREREWAVGEANRCRMFRVLWSRQDLSILSWHAGGTLGTNGQTVFWFYRIWEGCSGFLEQGLDMGVGGNQSKPPRCYLQPEGLGAGAVVYWFLCWVTHLLVPWCPTCLY